MKGTAVRIQGVLCSRDGESYQESDCDLLVRRRLAGSTVEYTEGFVLYASPGIPDGDYLAHFDGHTMHVRKEHGRWLYSNCIVRQLNRPELSAHL